MAASAARGLLATAFLASRTWAAPEQWGAAATPAAATVALPALAELA
jgi:hypothetical protein